MNDLSNLLDETADALTEVSPDITVKMEYNFCEIVKDIDNCEKIINLLDKGK